MEHYYSLERLRLTVKVRCPDCKEIAELADDFSLVKCSSCSFDMTYGEYVKYIAYKDAPVQGHFERLQVGTSTLDPPKHDF